MDQINATSEEIQVKIQGVLEKISAIKSQFFSVLDDFTKYYVLHNSTPDSEEYNTIFNQNKSQIQGVQTNLFNINNTIEKSSETINAIKATIDESIQENKDKITELENKISILSSGEDASIMKNDFVKMYNFQYLANFCMFTGIIIILVLFGTLFKNNIPAMPQMPSIPSSMSGKSFSPVIYH